MPKGTQIISTAVTPTLRQAFEEAVRSARSVFMTAHVNPDGDTLGSMLALRHTFARHFSQMERIDCAITGKMPDMFHFLPGIDSVQSLEHATGLLESYDLAISVDCGSLERLGLGGAYFKAAQRSINIDHHVSNQAFGQLNIIVPDASASGEIVAGLLENMGLTLDKAAATCVYAAVLTDTGGFKYSNTTQAVFELAAKLVKAGADPEEIYKHMYEIRSKEQVALSAEALAQIQLDDSGQVGWTVVTQDMFNRHQALEEHTEGLVEAVRQIDTVLLAAFFRETSKGSTKVSLRSDDHRFNVAAVMEKFGGGGHKMAAGCTIEDTVDAAIAQVIPLLQAQIRSVG